MKTLRRARTVLLHVLLPATLAMGMALLPMQTVRAAACTVTSNSDSGSGSLRSLVADATCNTINFSGNTAILLASTLTIGHNVTIDGTGHAVSISGQNVYQVFYVDPGVSAIFDHLTVTQGNTSDLGPQPYGGGLRNKGTLTVTDSTLVANTGGWGGAIWNDGVLTVTDSTFDSNKTPGGDGAAINNRGSLSVTGSTFKENSAGYYGGAIYNNGSTAIVTGSTFVGNESSEVGGAIYNTNSRVTVANSTFTGNQAYVRGGGVFNSGSTLTLSNDTFSGNSAWITGADVFNFLFSTLNYANTILANPLAGADCANSMGTIGTNTQNLVSDGSCGAALSGIPDLGPLAANGGPTETMALLAGSPAIDAGDGATCAASPVNNEDQRGVTRPQGAGCDIGAYEYGPIVPLVTSSNPAAGATVPSPNQLSVTFNQDMRDDGSSKAADNPANYLLVEAGPNGVFDTLSCQDGRLGDDTNVPIAHASYASGTQTATLTLAAPLRPGAYRLFVCGTTSIWSVAGLELNNGGSDSQIDFDVSSSIMPSTGFAAGRISALGAQEVSYAPLGSLWLDIPRLGVQTPIVGVPESADGSWDVSWLGNDAGWLNGTAFPTWPGNSVLTGHVYNSSGLPGPFQSISTLRWGDPVIIHADGAEYVYGVREVMQVGPEDVGAMLQHEDRPWVTLVTCRGYKEAAGGYEYRILVRAVLMDVK
ncbi:MAG: choice-of-anchor Q domain-containing protein [Anaerolineales bacterium]